MATDRGRGRSRATRYAFSLDGGPPRPDPRSPSPARRHRRPLGGRRPRRASRGTTTAGAASPLAGAVLYELHVGTFTAAGTFDAAIDRLPHLVELGVDAVELLPGRRVLGRARVGLRRRRPVRPPPRLRRPRRAQAPRRRLPRARARRRDRRRLQPPRPGGELPRRVRPVLHRPPPHQLGRRGELRRTRERRGAPLRRSTTR